MLCRNRADVEFLRCRAQRLRAICLLPASGCGTGQGHAFGCRSRVCRNVGSGAAVFGLFENAKMAEAAVAGITDCDTFVAEVPDAFGLVER